MPRIHAIQYLRAVAALLVVLFHVLEPTPYPLKAFAAGVDIFFIISGFVIGALIADPSATAPDFLWRRAVRVLPPYWLASLCVLALADPQPDPDTLWSSLLLLPHLNAEGHAAPLLEQGWTLYFEVFFYVLAACVLTLAPIRRGPALAAVLATLAGLGFALSTHGAESPPIWRVWTSPLLLEFIVGLGFAWLWRRGEFKKLSTLLALAALATGAAALILDMAFNIMDGAPRWLRWGAPAALVAAGALGLEARGKIKPQPALLLLGDASYVLYLFHTLVFSLITAVSAKLGLGLDFLALAPVKVAAALAVCVALHLALERPALRWLQRLPGTFDPHRAEAPQSARHRGETHRRPL